ncbi:MAG: hypothetical protein AB8H86_13380 [Polyangiales bacterium]
MSAACRRGFAAADDAPEHAVFRLSEQEIRLCRRLLRTLVFQPAATLLGQSFVVERLVDFPRAAGHLMRGRKDAQLATSIENVERTLIKYELADLRFSLGQASQDLAPAGAKVLASLIGEDEPDPFRHEESETQARIEFLEDLVSETQQGDFELRVFCTSSFLGLKARAKATRGWTQLPPGFFPRKFEVTDAYVTNAPSIGMLRNFYL